MNVGFQKTNPAFYSVKRTGAALHKLSPSGRRSFITQVRGCITPHLRLDIVSTDIYRAQRC